MNKDPRQSNVGNYFDNNYGEIGRGGFMRMFHQIEEVLNTKPNNILEIGIGNRFVSNYLKSRKINITTFDIDEKLEPDVVGDVRELNKHFNNNSYDTILCAEVLEHLPFEYFEKCLIELKNVTKKNLILTLPHHALNSYFHLKIPLLKPIKFNLTIPFPLKYKWKIGGSHYWEIGWGGYSFKKIKKEIENHFTIKETYLVNESLFHRVFVLEKLEHNSREK